MHSPCRIALVFVNIAHRFNDSVVVLICFTLEIDHHLVLSLQD